MKSGTKRIFAFLLMLGPLSAGAQAISFGLFGDTPYTHWERENLPDLMAEMDSESLAFVVHDGDIKSGSSPCSDDVLSDILGVFQSSATPLVYVPGDNDWTDCHRQNNGGYDPLERLAALRKRFFVDDMSLGKRKIPLQRQSSDAAFAQYRENVRWEAGGALFVGLNLPGGGNNFHGTGRSGGPVTEFIERSAANHAWVAQAFALARAKKLSGLLIAIQANPEFEAANAGAPNPGYIDFLTQLREETLAFGGQVVLVHGDTHRHRIDQPLWDAKTRKNVANFTRVETFGSPFYGWVKGTVNPNDPQVFNFLARPWRKR